MSSKNKKDIGARKLIVAVIILIMAIAQLLLNNAQKEREEWLNEEVDYKLCGEFYTGEDGKTYFKPDTSSPECEQLKDRQSPLGAIQGLGCGIIE